MASLEQAFGEVFAELGRQQAEFAALRERVDKVSVTVTSSKRILTVTAGPKGEITKVKFNDTGYRDLAPAELSTLVQETLEKARKAAADKVAEAVGGFTGPGGMSIEDIRSGNFDVQKLLPSGLSTNPGDMLAFLRGKPAATPTPAPAPDRPAGPAERGRG